MLELLSMLLLVLSGGFALEIPLVIIGSLWVFRKNGYVKLYIIIAYILMTLSCFFASPTCFRISMYIDQYKLRKGLVVLAECQHRHYKIQKTYESVKEYALENCNIDQDDKKIFSWGLYFYTCNQDEFNVYIDGPADDRHDMGPVFKSIHIDLSPNGFTCVAVGQLASDIDRDIWIIREDNKIYHYYNGIYSIQNYKMTNDRIEAVGDYYKDYYRRFKMSYRYYIGLIICLLAEIMCVYKIKKSYDENSPKKEDKTE